MRPQHLQTMERVPTLWPRRSFTIHGFWPGPRSNQYYGKFSINAANPIKHLYTYWPPRSEAFRGVKKTFKEEYFLWIHEWEKHGKDFADQVLHILGKKSFPSRFNQRNRALQTRYFQDTLDLFLKIRATSLAKNPTTKQELAALLGISDRSFSTRCLPSGNLQELQICVKVMKTGASLTYQIVNCTRMKSNCPGNAVHLNQFRWLQPIIAKNAMH